MLELLDEQNFKNAYSKTVKKLKNQRKTSKMSTSKVFYEIKSFKHAILQHINLKYLSVKCQITELNLWR